MKLLNGMLSEYAAKKREKDTVLPSMTTGSTSTGSPGRSRKPAQKAAHLKKVLNGQPTGKIDEEFVIQKDLHDLFIGAKLERLECALPLIEAIQDALDSDRSGTSVPAGTLTVKGWMGLLNRWELQLRSIRPSQARYLREYLEEMVTKKNSTKSPLVPMLRELISVVESAQIRLDLERSQKVSG
ncbi:MAG: hypothetical protein HQL54_00330 [Magnetococcales bacterium]|nr:hypothetical protein [Magnetococcales bacterium]